MRRDGEMSFYMCLVTEVKAPNRSNVDSILSSTTSNHGYATFILIIQVQKESPTKLQGKYHLKASVSRTGSKTIPLLRH